MAAALGIYQFASRITTNTDTSLVAAPGKKARINIRWMTAYVETANANGLIRIEDGAGGTVLATLDASDDNNRLAEVYHVRGGSRGRQLSENTALSAESSNMGVVVVAGEVEITGV